MIHAAIKGKLNGTLDCLRSEDALTAAVFGHLRYLSPSVLSTWLATARNHVTPSASWVARNSEPDVEFWPTVKVAHRDHRWVQPDIVMAFQDEVVIVEAKLWSPKSVTKGGVDQLAREWHGITEHYHGRAKVAALVYLTPHGVPPQQDLDESAQELGADASCLWWLSWSTLAPILEQQVANSGRMSQLVAADLLEYLHKVGVVRFRGWRLASSWQHNPCWRYRIIHPVPYARYWHDYSRQEPLWRYRR